MDGWIYQLEALKQNNDMSQTRVELKLLSLWMTSLTFVPVWTESHSWARALWCFESVYQTSNARTVEQASFERTEAETCGTGGDEGGEKKKKSNRKCFRQRAVGAAHAVKKKMFLRQEKCRSERPIQAVCFVVLQRRETDARPCNVGMRTYIRTHANLHTNTLKLFIYNTSISSAKCRA